MNEENRDIEKRRYQREIDDASSQGRKDDWLISLEIANRNYDERRAQLEARIAELKA